MLSLMFGLIAAVAWGVHDLLVRRVSQGTNVLGQILAEMAVGLVVLVPFAGGQMMAMSGWAAVYGGVAGISYIIGFIGLYRAFGLAPARVVSPVLGAFPLVSLLIAVAQGQTVPVADWLAVVTVVLGVGVVSVLARSEAGPQVSVTAALLWAGLGAVGFAVAYAFGQAVAVDGSPLAALTLTRLVAMLCAAAGLMALRPTLRPIWDNWRLLAAMGALDTVALGLVMAAGRFPHPEYASVAASLFGVATILLAWRVLNEVVRPAQWLGIGLVFAGILKLAV